MYVAPSRTALLRDLAAGVVTLHHPDPITQAALEAAIAKDPELIAAALTAGEGAPAPRPAGKKWPSTVEAAEQLGVARCTLDEMLARAPKKLPGSPEHVGKGSQRRHLRWNVDKLDEWLSAYRNWEECDGCALRSQCTRAKAGTGRSIKVHEDEAFHQELRARLATKEGRAELRQRTDVEHGLAHVVRRQGQRARYRGTRKNLFDLRRVCAVENLLTLDHRLRMAA